MQMVQSRLYVPQRLRDWRRPQRESVPDSGEQLQQVHVQVANVLQHYEELLLGLISSVFRRLLRE
jgi:hypothetical protein